MKIITDLNGGFNWYRNDRVNVKGQLIDSAGVYLEGKNLLGFFEGVSNAHDLETKLEQCNGNFAVAIKTLDGEILAAVDHVRSIPLFYYQKGDEFLVTDNVDSIIDENRTPVVDPISREEFLQVGFVVGSDTLFPEIKQLQAGELVAYKSSNQSLITTRYFSHEHGNYFNSSKSKLIQELDELTRQWAQRLITSAGGRTLVLGLSGGYDSRSIACAVKRENYDSVICFSYGNRDSWEHKIASQVAETLGYPFHLVEYNKKRWAQALGSDDFRKFCERAFQYSAIPCIQEFTAIRSLKDRKTIPQDSILVPGYCGDVLGGSYVPNPKTQGSFKKLVSKSVEHYISRNLFGWVSRRPDKKTQLEISTRISRDLNNNHPSQIQDFCNALEDWVTRNTLSKFIINTIRTYENFGFEWRLPLWDQDLINWWYRVPLEHRQGSQLFHSYLFDHLFEPLNVGFYKPTNRSTKNALRRWIPEEAYRFLSRIKTKILSKDSRKQDINDFGPAGEVLLGDLSSAWVADDFNIVNAIVGAWCLEQFCSPD